MIIRGFQKLTLLDFPGHVACTVFTGGCNFRCPFCHNSSLVLKPGEAGDIPEDEVFRILKKRVGVLDGVAVTGGEPTMMPDLKAFLLRVKSMGFAAKLDSNGTAPAVLRDLIESGAVDYIAMDIKNCREKYALTAGVPGMDLAPIEESVALLKEGRVDYEFRTTVVRGYHEAEDFRRIGEWIAGAPKYFLQVFKNSGELIDGSCEGFSHEDMQPFADAVQPFVGMVEIRG